MQYKELIGRLLSKGKVAFYRDVAFEIGQNIASVRALLGISQYELARRLGTKQPSIARLEKGTKLPSLSFLQRVADALGYVLVEPRIISRQEFVEEYLLGSNVTKTDFLSHGAGGEAIDYIYRYISTRTDDSTADLDEFESVKFSGGEVVHHV